jgi:general nucleoside transport system ATP-binding protein
MSPSPHALSPPAVEFRRVSKTFGAVRANRDVTLKIAGGHIHGIIGENGAGKSTLMSILYGLHEPDEGHILIDGAVRKISSPSDAMSMGIGMVHQHFMLVEPFTVIENVMLGAEGGMWLRRRRGEARAVLQQLEDTYQLGVPMDTRVRDLPVGLQQRVEILKALYRKAKILILDEPTAVLTPGEIDLLFRILGVLRSQGTTVALITHKLKEIMAITDTVSVLRQGEMVGTFATTETDQAALASMMVGRSLTRNTKPTAKPATHVVLDACGLDYVDSLGVHRLKKVSLTLRRGEIIGVAGVSGNGQSELLAVLAGLLAPTAGTITVNGTVINGGARRRSRTTRGSGVAHIPEDRLRDGIVLEFGAEECSILGRQNEPGFNGRVLQNRRAIRDFAGSLMAEHDVRPLEPTLKMAAFSGGNQQKLVVGRELARNPSILLVGQPTRGVDIGAIESIHARLLALRDAGLAIVLVSSELEEICQLSDKVIVMCAGEIVGEMAGHEVDVSQLGLLMAGVVRQ